MKPIQLKIKGLNSFTEEQVIDFSRLTENGLFGIFGPTGSGKSTVLDAIILALYGRIPRSGGKPSGIVNTQSDKVQVIYEFAVGEGQNRRTYSVQRVFKRTGADGVKAELATVHDISQPDNPRPLYEGSREVNAGIIAIIGLSAEDFTRSVVLPQGSFSEFLQLSGTDRRNMLERIFGMEKYGDQITQMIRNYKRKKHNERTYLEGVLSSFQDISPEAYTCINEECQNLRKQKDDLAASWQDIDKNYLKYLQVWTWQQERQKYKQIEIKLGEQADTFAIRTIALQKAEDATILKPLIEKVLSQHEELNSRQKNLEIKLKGQEDLGQCLQITRQNWEQATLKKEHDLPQLLIKKNHLELANKIAGQIKELADERELLRDEYQSIRTDLNQSEITLRNNQDKIEQMQLILGAQREKINALKLTPDYRERVSEGARLEKECFVGQAKQAQLLPKMTSLETDLRNNESQLALIVSQRDGLEMLCQERLNHRQELINQQPGSNEDLLNQQHKLNEMENELRSLLQWSQSWDELEKGQTEFRSQLLSIEEQLIDRKQVMADCIEQRDLLTTNLDREKSHHMAATLAQELKVGEACPVCGSLHHPAAASDIGSGSLLAITDMLDMTVQTIRAQEREIQDLEMQHLYLVKEIKRLNSELEKLSEQIGGRKVVYWQDRCAEQKSGLEKLKIAIKDWEVRTSQNESALAHDQELLGNLKNQAVIQTAALKKDQETAQILLGEYDQVNERLQESQQRYASFQILLGLNNIEGMLIEIVEMDRELHLLDQENQELEGSLKGFESQSSALQEDVQGLRMKITQFEAIGSEKSKLIEQKNLELKDLCQDQEPSAGLISVQSEIDAIHVRYAQLTETYEQQKERYEELSRLCSNLVISNQALERMLHEQETDLARQLVARKFNNISEVQSSFMTESEIAVQKQNIEEYREQVRLNMANLARVSALLKDEQIEETVWQRLQDQRGQIQKELEEATNHLLLREDKRADMEKRIQELTKLKNQKQEIDHQYGLLEELENIFKGKKFIDFIARTRLNYMAREASQTLRDISRGRYALELSPEGEFIMRDDFSGGARRPTHTLSGGETFLTSLALALALSSHIQLGKASLEFFFLDEGFGTLDAEVLDIVVGALEKLHSDKLSVGIISHVEELKFRIPHKLIMNPARPGISGTTVSID